VAPQGDGFFRPGHSEGGGEYDSGAFPARSPGGAAADNGDAPGDDRIWEDVAELALHEWGIHPDDFWDERSNTVALVRARGGSSAGYGLTIPRLYALLEAFQRRVKGETYRQAAVLRAAYHEPNKLDSRLAEQFRPEVGKPGERDSDFAGDPGEGEFVKAWWRATPGSRRLRS
jgi:hypothetical protein